MKVLESTFDFFALGFSLSAFLFFDDFLDTDLTVCICLPNSLSVNLVASSAFSSLASRCDFSSWSALA